MRLRTSGFVLAVGMTLIIPAASYAADGSEVPAGVSEPAPPATDREHSVERERLADAPENVGRSFRQAGDSVETGAKTVGHTVEDGARRFGRSVAEGWRSFRRGLTGD
jgi:hypothetical protein